MHDAAFSVAIMSWAGERRQRAILPYLGGSAVPRTGVICVSPVDSWVTGATALRGTVPACRGALAEVVNGHAHAVHQQIGTTSCRPAVWRDLWQTTNGQSLRWCLHRRPRDPSSDGGSEHAFAHVRAQAICSPTEVTLVEFDMGRVINHFETASPDQLFYLRLLEEGLDRLPSALGEWDHDVQESLAQLIEPARGGE
jgi:hypothetical protein